MAVPAVLDGIVYTVADLAAFLQRDFPADGTDAQGNPVSKDAGTADLALRMATAAVRSYTRGRGFVVDSTGKPVMAPALAGVVLTVAARLFANPTQLEGYQVGDVSTRGGAFAGFTLAELAVLHDWRRRSA